MTEDRQVTVLIPHWNRADLLRTVLKHLAVQTYPIARTVIIDNGSADDSIDVARAAGAEVIALDTNRGFAFAVNRGLESVATGWVAIVNNDVGLEPDWLEQMVHSASTAGAGFAAGKCLSARSPAELDGTWDLVCCGGTAWRAGSGWPDGPSWSVPRRIHFTSLTAALFRRSVFDRVGLLDERFGSYLEDVDLGLRCAAAGLSGVYVPAARAYHKGSATRGAWHKDTVRQIARNQSLILFKHFRGGPRWPALVAQLLWGLVALRHRAGRAYLVGKLEALRGRSGWSQTPSDWASIRETVTGTERELFDLQRKNGFDLYWRLYFLLTGGAGN